MIISVFCNQLDETTPFSDTINLIVIMCRDFGKSQDFLKKNVIPQEILKIFVISQEVDAKNSKKHPGNVTFVEMPPGY